MTTFFKVLLFFVFMVVYIFTRAATVYMGYGVDVESWAITTFGWILEFISFRILIYSTSN